MSDRTVYIAPVGVLFHDDPECEELENAGKVESKRLAPEEFRDSVEESERILFDGDSGEKDECGRRPCPVCIGGDEDV